MLRGLIRLLSFFAKELAEVRRQPRLVISLVLGPFLILALFGLGYSGEQPKLRTILVVPSGMERDPRVQNIAKNLGPAFQVLNVTSILPDAREQLNRGETDIVEVVPPNVDQLLGSTAQSPITVLYNQI